MVGGYSDRVSKRIKREDDHNYENRAGNVCGQPLAFRNNDENRIAHLARQVFQDDMLRELILTHAIQNDGLSDKQDGDSSDEEGDHISYKDANSTRLVGKAWMNDVSRIMRNMRKPLYKFRMSRYTSLHASSQELHSKMKILDNFISTVALSASRPENVLPPFSLYIDPYFFEHENRQRVSDFLAGASTAAGLVELELYIRPNGCCTDLFFCGKIPHFPILEKLTVRFCRTWEDRKGSLNCYFLPFLKSILHGANHLKKIVVPFCTRRAVIPADIKYLTLPRSLTYLKLDCVLTSAQMEGLATTCIPNLINLSLPVHYIVYSNNLIFRILDQCKETLRTLSFTSVLLWPENIPKTATYFHFPTMKCLDSFNSNSVFAELNPKLAHSLQTFLPKLSNLSLTCQSVKMLRKWTTNSCFSAINELTVSLVDDNFTCCELSHHATIRLKEMQAIHMAFPNVRVLELTVHGHETRALKYMFREMKQLTELSIRIGEGHDFTNSYHLDSLLTGIPIPSLKKLEISTQFWKNVNGINLKGEERCSLRNLIELQRLRLISNSLAMTERSEIMCSNWGPSLISAAVFHLAFLQMPKLKMLDMEGNFRPSREIYQVWVAEQRLISHKN